MMEVFDAEGFLLLPHDSETGCDLWADGRVDSQGKRCYLDSMVSVSGLKREREHTVEFWDEDLIDEQERRFLNGS